jgi:phosphoribosylaminoimidazole-succinocarboxamide synthase
MSLDDQTLRAQLGQILDRTDFHTFAGRGALEHYDGKVRDCYIDKARGERILIVSDRLSAFDRVVATIPFKGQVLNQCAQYWFEETASIAPNHLVSTPDPNVAIGRECEPLLVEFVMRAYLTGVTSTSIWHAYSRGERTFCGHALPDGLRKNEPLPAPILTPTTKAPKGEHDVSASRDELLAWGSITADRFDAAAAIAARLFAHGRAVAASRGLILVDTKYEMGIDPSGQIIVIDEIHTPDSSRYWFADDYESRLSRAEEPRSLDKEFVRRWFVEEARYSGDGPTPPMPDDVRIEAARRYIANYELVTGRTFVPDTRAPVPRIAAALGAS